MSFRLVQRWKDFGDSFAFSLWTFPVAQYHLQVGSLGERLSGANTRPQYFAWKTEERAITISVVEWLACLGSVSLPCLSLFDIHRQNSHIIIFRQVYFTENKPFLVIIFCAFIVSVLVLCLLVFCSV